MTGVDLRLRAPWWLPALVLLTATMVVACGSTPLASDNTAEGTNDEPTVTTLDAGVPLQDPNVYRSPTRIPAFEGMGIDEARDAALAAGWTVISVHDIDEPQPESDTDYFAEEMGLHARDGIVIEAWTGGKRPG